MSVLITAGQNRSALTVVRSLGKKNVHVTVGDIDKLSASFYSKYCKQRFLYPSPSENPRRFADYLLKIVRQNRIDVLIPSDLCTTLVLSKYKSMFKHYVKLPIADFDQLSFANNKALITEFAIKNNIPCPQTWFVKDLNELKNISREIGYPAVVKPRSLQGAHGVKYAYSPADLVQKYHLIHRSVQEYPIIQEYIKGVGYGVEALFNAKSQPRAVFVHKRLRELPPTGGPSTLRESVHAPEIRNYGLKLLKLLHWFGLAMVEFKYDANDKCPKLMEINPRVWGSLALAVKAGIDFPFLLYKMALDEDVEPEFRYKLGVKCRWLSGDISSFKETLLKGPNRRKVTIDFLRFYEKNQAYDYFTFDDPAPSSGVLINYLWRVFRAFGCTLF